MAWLIRGGEVVTAEGRRFADVLCEGETISRVGPGLEAPDGAEIMDATGQLVFPGFVDPHVHAYLPLSYAMVKSDYADCTRAALLGGTTCIMDFAGSGAEADLNEAWKIWTERAEGKASCDYSLHLTITRFDDEAERQLAAFVEKGLKSIKIYLAYKPALAINDEDLFRLLTFAATHDLVVMAHCENPDMIPAMQQKFLSEGKTGPEWHEPSRPPIVEAEGVCRFLTLAALTGARAYVVHVSCIEALTMADRFRDKVRELYLEGMIHYLVLDRSYAERPDFEGAKWILSPPLRGPADQAELWKALADGRLDTLGTDHCPFDFKGQKEAGRGDFTKIPNGISGVEERVALAYTLGVLAGKITLERLVEVASANPAKIFGLWPRKGTLAEGSDADVVVWDPEAKRTISQKTQSIDTDYNPYEGIEVCGAPRIVTVRGEIMVRDGEFVGTPGQGRLL